MNPVQEILENIDKCCFPKLSPNLEECENHIEFSLWEKNLTENFPNLFKLIDDCKLLEGLLDTTILSSMMILCYELQSDGPWKIKKCDEYLRKINQQFEVIYELNLNTLLQGHKDYNSQNIFDKIIELLHTKLTLHDFKKYPALTEVYFRIIKDIKNYEIILKPSLLLPASLLLIDDYIIENKIKGLKCCSLILACLTPDHFCDGNYNEVIYVVLKKNITEKDIKLIKLVLECLMLLIETLPNQAKISTIDDTLHTVLEQMYTDTNLYKKKLFFIFLNKILHIHGIHSGKTRLFLIVIGDNLDICTNDAVAVILLSDVIECLENWIKYCWCVWRLQSNIKMLSVLIKLLYIHSKNVLISFKIQNILITLFKLCSIEDQKEIHTNLENFAHDVKGSNECFIQKLELIRNQLSV